MTISVVINILESGGGGSPPSIDPLTPDVYLPSVYDGTDFYVIFEFLIKETIVNPESGLEEFTLTPAFDVTSDFDFDNYTVTYTKINPYTVRLDGPVTNVFPDQFYRFVLPDLSTPILPFNTTQEFFSLIEYQKPSSNTILFEYDFKVYQTAPVFYETTIYQWITWKFSSAVANIKALVARGLK